MAFDKYLRDMNVLFQKHTLALMALPLAGVMLSISTSCNPSPQSTAETIPLLQMDKEAISFLGDTLARPVLDEVELNHADSLLEEAFILYKEDSTDLNAIIWYGRRLAYLHQYRDAIAIFSKGLQIHPQSPELFRHRGHRYITTRQLDLAIHDLKQAATLAEGNDLEIEPDGIPNKLNIPLSNLHFNIYYHLGLAYYLRSDYPQAIEAFKLCMSYSDNPDLKVATTFWLYLSYLRTKAKDTEESLLTEIHPDMEIIENDAYLRQLLFFKNGNESILERAAESDTLPLASTHYGISCWFDTHGDKNKAASIRHQILSSGMWTKFGFIAAEADSSRLMAE